MEDRLFKEAGTRHSGHPDFADHPLAEFQICKARKLRQGKESADV